ncbi:MAG: hypothetical protein A2511_13460 [Deltaproteobacteria bacterium RIFOXYD12_FULL_50_9]|nr:MAG: hypothetical protein A2511_13460 [Deltaproteobacteria bacterium RIFOXYD12_FULL_50_9]
MKKTLFCLIIAMVVLTDQVKAANYTDNGNLTLTDNETTFMWQQQDDNTTRTWEEAIVYCEALDLGGHSDWRLPNYKELKSIVDYSAANPSINSTAFPGTDASDYWTSTTYAGSTSNAWLVSFNNGYVSPYYKSSKYYVRCVR